jgi:hypothetical protein
MAKIVLIERILHMITLLQHIILPPTQPIFDINCSLLRANK